jgi:membrane-bound metal-dependent hydrolase YbcI (DUF457 family)
MLGRDHALSGALAFAALAPTLHVTGANLATGIALGAGAGLLPDIDHPDSSVALSFGFVSNGFSWLVEKISGGHRHATHALIGLTVFTAGAYSAGRYQLSGPHPPYASPGSPAWHPALFWHLVPAGIFVTLLYSAALRALKIGGHHGDLIAMAGAAATLYYGTDLDVVRLGSWHVPLLALATGLGCVAHILGDELTHGGCPLLYPVSMHEFHLLPKPMRITTAKLAETYAVFPIVTIALAVAIWHATGHKV